MTGFISGVFAVGARELRREGPASPRCWRAAAGARAPAPPRRRRSGHRRRRPPSSSHGAAVARAREPVCASACAVAAGCRRDREVEPRSRARRVCPDAARPGRGARSRGASSAAPASEPSGSRLRPARRRPGSLATRPPRRRQGCGAGAAPRGTRDRYPSTAHRGRGALLAAACAGTATPRPRSTAAHACGSASKSTFIDRGSADRRNRRPGFTSSIAARRDARPRPNAGTRRLDLSPPRLRGDVARATPSARCSRRSGAPPRRLARGLSPSRDGVAAAEAAGRARA